MVTVTGLKRGIEEFFGGGLGAAMFPLLRHGTGALSRNTKCGIRSQPARSAVVLLGLLSLHFNCTGVEGSKIVVPHFGSAGVDYADVIQNAASRSPACRHGTCFCAPPGTTYVGSQLPLASSGKPHTSTTTTKSSFAEASPIPLEPSTFPEAPLGEENLDARDAVSQETPDVPDCAEPVISADKPRPGARHKSTIPSEDYHLTRQKQKQRRAQYIQSGQRFGSFSPPAPLNLNDKRTLNEKQKALEKTLDGMLDDTGVQVLIRDLPNCRLSIEAHISGEFTRKMWEFTLTSLRANLRQSTHASPLDVPEAFLLQKAGGRSAVSRDILRFMAELVARKARMRHNARILGGVDFEEELNVLADRVSPGSPLTLRLCAEAFPKVHFKRPYKGLQLRVPRKPYDKGRVFNMTESYLLYKHAEIVDYPEPQPPAKEGDTILVFVDRGWFEERDGSKGLEIPTEYIHGPSTLHLVKPWVPTELLEATEGIEVGERRTIRVSIPFPARHLLRICEQEENKTETTSASPCTNRGDAAPVRQGEDGPKERGIVPAYLESIATRTKENVFATLFGKSNGADNDAEDPAALSTDGELKQDEKTENDATAVDERRQEEPRDPDEEVHSVDCILEVECTGVKRRVVPKADDEFFLKTCNMTRAQLWNEVETAAEELSTGATAKHALGAAAAALDEIAKVEVPESLIDAQAEITWKQQLKTRELQGEDNSKLKTNEGFMKWKEENKRGIENILRTSYAIKAVCQTEGLEVDERQLECEIGKAMLQAPPESIETLAKNLYKKAQARLVYDFIVKHADIEYYLDETPAQVTVETEATEELTPNRFRQYDISGALKTKLGVKAFPHGGNIERWHKTREKAQQERDSLRDKAQRLYVDPKTLRRFGKPEGL